MIDEENMAELEAWITQPNNLVDPHCAKDLNVKLWN